MKKVLIILVSLFLLTQTALAQSTAVLINRAKDSIEKNDYASAVTDLTAAIRAAPRNTDAYAQRARANFLLDKADAAIADAEQALALDAKNTDAMNIRGLIKYNRKDYDSAIADFTSAVNIKPDLAKAFVNRARALIQKKDYAAALADLTAAIKIDPNFTEAYFQRAYTYRLKKDFQNALADANQLITLVPQNASAFSLRADIYYAVPDYNQAIADYSKAIVLNPGNHSAYYKRGLSSTYLEKPDYNVALADFTKYTELRPQDQNGFYVRGYAKMKLEMWKDAESDFGKAYDLGARDTALFNNLSYVQLQMKQYVWAAINARQSLEIDPQNEFAKNYLNVALTARQKPFDGALAKQMIDLVDADNIQGAIDLMNQGAEVNSTIFYQGVEKRTPLHIAAMRNNFQLVRALLAIGANPNEKTGTSGSTPLHFAAFYSRDYGYKNEIVKILLKNGADINATDKSGEAPIAVAILYGYDDLVELMIKAGAKVNFKYKAAEITPLMAAVESGTERTVKLLLAGGGDPNAASNVGFTPLHYAVWKKGAGLAKAWLLLKAGARIENLPIDDNTKNYLGTIEAIKRMAAVPKDSPEAKLFDAAADNNYPELALFLAANPAPADKTLLNYLLMMSIYQDNVPVMRSLIAKGADINYKINDDSILTVAKRLKKNAAAALPSDGTETVETNTTAQDEAKIAELINNAASATDFATRQLNKALEQRNAGREKAIWCLSINEAANSANASLKYIKQAQTIFTLKYKAAIQQAKENAEQSLKLTMSYGCPISLSQ